jgi:hypothetical protein
MRVKGRGCLGAVMVGPLGGVEEIQPGEAGFVDQILARGGVEEVPGGGSACIEEIQGGVGRESMHGLGSSVSGLRGCRP